MFGQKVVVGNDDRRIKIEDRINILKIEKVKVQPGRLRRDAAPAVINPDGVGNALPQGAGFIVEGVGGQVYPGKVTAIGL